MRRFLRSLILGLLIGAVCGLYFGWLHFPAEYLDSEMARLEQGYRDDYLLMIAAGYAFDGDAGGAAERLSRLGVDDAGEYVQVVTERVIMASSQSLSDIHLLVSLAEGLGRLSPVMQPFIGLGGDA